MRNTNSMCCVGGEDIRGVLRLPPGDVEPAMRLLRWLPSSLQNNTPIYFFLALTRLPALCHPALPALIKGIISAVT